MRDAALSMRSLALVNDFDFMQPYMTKYVDWVLQVQALADPNGIDVRTEPKFLFPQPEVFPGGWCRPQQDGPALRSTTLMIYAQALIENGMEDYVRQYLYTGSPSQYNGGAIKYDLDWVALGSNGQPGWQQNGCDLWEEVQSTDFFWNRINYRRALYTGAAFAQQMGDSTSAQIYLEAANACNATIEAHWNGQYVYESTNRPIDSAVILGFNNGCMEDGFFCPDSAVAGATMAFLSNVFYNEFAINQKDNANGIPGVLLGRYPGDTYAGGNPWILLSDALAECLYRAASTFAQRGQMPHREFRSLVGLDDETDISISDFAELIANAGDGVLYRVRYHVEPYDFHLSEQIDRNVGTEVGAIDLTWSYGTMIKAMWWRDNAYAAIEQARKDGL